MIYSGKPTKVEIYVNTYKKTAAQIKLETGADLVVNGGLYNSNWTPCCHLKVDGTVLAKDPYKYWGYGWDSNQLVLTQSYSKYHNYICCCCMVRKGKAEQLIYNSQQGGSRPRTAIGLYSDGRVWVYASMTQTTPEQLQRIALDECLDSAIMLDCGGSTQCLAPNDAVTSSRIVHNLICIWFRDLPKSKCPYREPTILIRRGSIGEGARWVQWHLKAHGCDLSIDGVIGRQSSDCIIAFQNRCRITPDGVVGSATRAWLKDGVDYV